jgi:hypothetical protein
VSRYAAHRATPGTMGVHGPCAVSGQNRWLALTTRGPKWAGTWVNNFRRPQHRLAVSAANPNDGIPGNNDVGMRCAYPNLCGLSEWSRDEALRCWAVNPSGETQLGEDAGVRCATGASILHAMPESDPHPPTHVSHRSSSPEAMTESVGGVADTRGHYRRQRSLYADDLTRFLTRSPESILGLLAGATGFPVTLEQRGAWREQIDLLHHALTGLEGRGRIYFEYAIPRLGKWIDVLLVLNHVVFVIEFKVGEAAFNRSAIDQVWDYALDLRNFHETSHNVPIAPILVATKAKPVILGVVLRANDALMPEPVCAGATQIRAAIENVLELLNGPTLDPDAWERGRYQPTPTIIEAARALYAGHSVEDISRSDAGAVNLTRTSAVIDRIIRDARVEGRKAICFVTGVPGAGKTLVGLDVATKHRDTSNDLHSVFLSGNQPLVAVLREALARDHIQRELAAGRKITKGDARRLVNVFIQNVHHFRDYCLIDPSQPPVDHVALFDEAQRAWDRAQTSFFMRRKKNQPDFDQSEPELKRCVESGNRKYANFTSCKSGRLRAARKRTETSRKPDSAHRRIHLRLQCLRGIYSPANLRLQNAQICFAHRQVTCKYLLARSSAANVTYLRLQNC